MPPTTLTDEQLNAAVAEKVMGCRDEKFPSTQRHGLINVMHWIPGWRWPSGKLDRKDNWSPATNASHDYEVLVYVREHGTAYEKTSMHFALYDMWKARAFGGRGFVMAYLSGDYARAALSAQEAKT